MKVALLLLLLLLLLSVALFRGWFFAGRAQEGRTGLLAVIDAFGLQWPFTLDTVSRITEVTLRQTAANESFATFKSVSRAKAPILEVELRLPASANCKKDGILILTIDPAARISTKDVMTRFGSQPDLKSQEPSALYEVSYTYKMKQPWVDLSFQFAGGTGYLMTVIFDAMELKSAENAGKWLDSFAVYPGARVLCWQHVHGNVAHIIWHSYATYDAPEKVIAFYMQAEGEQHAERNGNSVTFRHGDKTLSIHRASARDYPDCGKPPRPEDQTILIVSQAIRSS